MTREPTIADVRDAVGALPIKYLTELAKGPLIDDADEDNCRICELFDDYIYTDAETPWTNAVLTIVDYHRFYGGSGRDGRGPEAYRRCGEVYELARARLDRLDAILDAA